MPRAEVTRAGWAGEAHVLRLHKLQEAGLGVARAGRGQGWAPRPLGAGNRRPQGLKLPTYPQGNYRAWRSCEEHIHSGAWVKEASYWQLKAPQKCKAQCWAPWASPGGTMLSQLPRPSPPQKRPLPPSRTHQPTPPAPWHPSLESLRALLSISAFPCRPLPTLWPQKANFRLPRRLTSERGKVLVVSRGQA